MAGTFDVFGLGQCSLDCMGRIDAYPPPDVKCECSETIIKQLMLERRVLLISGPRQCSKTTLARELESDETEYRTLGDDTLREADENDPQGFIKHSVKMLIVDGVQRVPSLLSAINCGRFPLVSCGLSKN